MKATSRGHPNTANTKQFLFASPLKSTERTLVTPPTWKKNFNDADLGFSRWCTTKEQTPVSIDVYKRRDGIYTIIAVDEVRDNIFNASTIGELVTFLNLCGHNDFVSKLKF